jgi:23S rRNA (pseudouridine1915-N3)-methyltransferase
MLALGAADRVRLLDERRRPFRGRAAACRDACDGGERRHEPHWSATPHVRGVGRARLDLSIARVKLTVLAVGRLRPPYVDDVEHYSRLLTRHAKLELVEVREGDRVQRRLGQDTFVSLLDVEGERYDSVQFADFIEERRQAGRDVCFVIGGAMGLELADVEHRFSLGPLTLPHQLARVVLLEQLYRAHKIIAGETYHY